MIDDIPYISFHKSKRTTIEFEVLTLKRLFSRKNKLIHPLDQPHRAGFYHILYITKGRGRHFIDFRPYHYAKGSLMFISTGQVHAFELNPGIDGYLLLFTENFLIKNMAHSDVLSFSRWYNYHLYPPVIKPLETSVCGFSAIFQELYHEYGSKDAFAKEEMLQTLLKLLLIKAERIQRTLTPEAKNAEWMIRFNEFRQLLAMHFPETRNAKSYAGMMNISYNHLNNMVKAITGGTVKSFIDSFVILEIKRKMAVSDISVKELTYAMGFDEPTNFVKYFKKHTRQSPARFRKTLAK